MGDVAACVDMNIKKNISKPHNPATPNSMLSAQRLTCLRRTSCHDTHSVTASTTKATAIGDILYYSGAGTSIYRHDFTTGESKLMINAKNVVENANIVYNNIAVHPLTGRVYLNTIKAYGWDFLINNISVFKPEGDALALEVNYEDHTHFPAGIFFPANFE